MNVKTFPCIICPKGCSLEVDVENRSVKGNGCPRGEVYGLAEATAPTRTLTSTARVVDKKGEPVDLVSVKTAAPIPKGSLFDAMKEIDALRVRKPLRRGDVLIDDLLGLGISVVATRDVL